MKIVAKPIDVIATFYVKGMLVPCKFRYEDEKGYKTIKVDKVVSVDEMKIAGVKTYVYRCQSMVGETTKTYELKYIIEKCNWQLYKI